MTATITETCSCGATFTATANTSSMLDYSAKKWREDHQHAESVGICGDQVEWTGPENWPHQPIVCKLKAAHDGLHSDGEAHWLRDPNATGELT